MSGDRHNFLFSFLIVAGLAQASQVQIDSGTLEGQYQDGVYSFLGVPYAEAPVGELRWRAPRPVAGWPGVRPAKQYGPTCMQIPYPKDLPYYKPLNNISENCLSLNIWTRKPDARLPVMVWFHGGSLTRGEGSSSLYDGTHFANQGIVMVTINYRLNVFGYFAHPELSAEQGGSSGNYGTLDQIQALKWVRDNIGHFGGDPENVTIIGESSGGWAVTHMMSSPMARGLFHKAIGQSGASLARIPELKGADGAETRAGLALQHAAGAGNLAALRELDAESIVNVYAANRSTALGAIVDGTVIPEQPQVLFREGRFNSVDSLVGFNKDEATAMAPYIDVPANRKAWNRGAEERFGKLARDYLRLYEDIAEARGPQAAYLAGWGDSDSGWGMRFWARSVEASGRSAFQYFFTRRPPTDLGRRLGAFHAAELGYVFATSVPDDRIDERLSRYMLRYWSNFARHGNPNGKGLPHWPSAGSDENYLELGARVGPIEALSKERFDFWSRVFAIE